jgi:hypothetical protein
MNSEKNRRQRLYWQRIKKRGHVVHLALSVLIFAGGYAFVRLCHVLAFRAGLMRSPGSTSLEDIFITAVVTGLVFGQLEWSDLKRKFKDPPPEEDWMAK